MRERSRRTNARVTSAREQADGGGFHWAGGGLARCSGLHRGRRERRDRTKPSLDAWERLAAGVAFGIGWAGARITALIVAGESPEQTGGDPGDAVFCSPPWGSAPPGCTRSAQGGRRTTTKPAGYHLLFDPPRLREVSWIAYVSTFKIGYTMGGSRPRWLEQCLWQLARDRTDKTLLMIGFTCWLPRGSRQAKSAPNGRCPRIGEPTRRAGMSGRDRDVGTHARYAGQATATRNRNQ